MYESDRYVLPGFFISSPAGLLPSDFIQPVGSHYRSVFASVGYIYSFQPPYMDDPLKHSALIARNAV